MGFGCWLEPLGSSSSMTLNVSPDFISPFGEGDAETVVLSHAKNSNRVEQNTVTQKNS